ncbi:MAG TPA: DUF1634 domain-containing protein [Candidatus Limnocylindria bacterium]
MTTRRRPDLLGGGIAAVLRIGTLVAIAAIGIGYVAILASGAEPGSPSLVDLLLGGGAPAVIGIGLLGLTMIPAGVLAVAAIGFWQHGERRRVAIALVVLALVLASLGTAILVTPPG